MVHKLLFEYIVNYNKESVSSNGIYMVYHINKENIYYIGSAFRKINKKFSKNGCYARWVEHFNSLKNNKHHSKYLQNVVNKYGLEGLRFQIILNVNDKTIIRNIEKLYIIKYDSVKNGYNSSIETTHPEMSEEARKRSSIRMKKNNPMRDPTIIAKVNNKPKNWINRILQFSKNGKFLKEWDNIQQASLYYNINNSNINRAVNNNAKSSGGYIWFYKYEFSENKLKEKVQNVLIHKPFSKESNDRRSNTQSKKVACFKENKLIKIYDSIKKAGEELKVDSSNISRAANNISKRCASYEWKFI